MRELIFVDTETTGLDEANDKLVELTWAREEGDPTTLYFGVKEVPDFIDKLIGFRERGIAGKVSTAAEFQAYTEACTDNTMVAANPAFDKAFATRWALFPFYYRMLDIESYAMGKLDLDYVPGMKGIYDILNERGYEIVQPDHTSYNDVLAMRDAYHILRKM